MATQVKIDGQQLNGFLAVRAKCRNPVGGGGYPARGTTSAMEVTLVRNPVIAPSTKGLALACGDDGRRVVFAMEIEVRNAAGNLLESFNLNKAVLVQFKSDDPPLGHGTATETWIVESGDATYGAGAESVDFALATWASVS